MAEVTTDKKLVAEFIGTAALVIGGPGTAAATFKLLNGAAETPTAYAFDMSHLGIISFAFMMVILAIIYSIGHISGCHINPAMTLALAAAKKMPAKDVPGYMIAQFTGATAGAFAIWGILGKDGLDAGLGVLSYVKGNTGHAFFAELIGTFLLGFVVFSTAVDSRATPGWYGLAIPAIVFAVITVAAPVTGAALNPARYIGPMIAAAALGKDGLLWEQVPVYFIATFIGGLIAAGVYMYLGDTPSVSAPSSREAERVSA
jgi:glycerol uptake facilitator protein